MKYVIHKYTLKAYPTQQYIPKGATFLCLQVQHDEPQMWFQVPLPIQEREQRNFDTRPTGAEFYTGVDEVYRGTFQLNDGALVFHVFELL